MKIMIFSDDFPPKSGGGAAVIASTHAYGLLKKGHEVTVVTTVEDKGKVGEYRENGIKIIRLYSRYSPSFRSYLSLHNPFISSSLEKILKSENPDIVHAHNIHYHLSYHSLKLARKYGKALFLTIHDSMPFHYSKLFPKAPYDSTIKSYRISPFRQLKDFRFRWNPFRNIIIKKYLSLPDKIFAVSDALKNALTDNGIKNVDVINNGIDIEKWNINENKLQDFRNKYNLVGKKVIMFCGRLSRAKGGEVLIKCLPDIVGKLENTVLMVVGERDYMASSMLSNAERLGIDSSIVFTGRLTGDDLISAYRASNLLVVPSLCFDWFPTVNLEAMAVGLPIIATCFGGSREAVIDGINGYIINPYHQSEIVDRTIWILSDDDKALRFGQEGYRRVREEFGIEKYIQKILSYYNKTPQK